MSDQPDSPGCDKEPCLFCGYPFDTKSLGKYGCPNCHGEGLPPPRHDGWIHEDELPPHYPYDQMFPQSQVRDGVRMFPEVTQ
jgi:hypothetical protein